MSQSMNQAVFEKRRAAPGRQLEAAPPKTRTLVISQPQTRRNKLRSLVKALIVRLALRGLVPVRLADWMIQCGGLSHD